MNSVSWPQLSSNYPEQTQSPCLLPRALGASQVSHTMAWPLRPLLKGFLKAGRSAGQRRLSNQQCSCVGRGLSGPGTSVPPSSQPKDHLIPSPLDLSHGGLRSREGRECARGLVPLYQVSWIPAPLPSFLYLTYEGLCNNNTGWASGLGGRYSGEQRWAERIQNHCQPPSIPPSQLVPRKLLSSDCGGGGEGSERVGCCPPGSV